MQFASHTPYGHFETPHDCMSKTEAIVADMTHKLES
jgi:hypothetical protein